MARRLALALVLALALAGLALTLALVPAPRALAVDVDADAETAVAMIDASASASASSVSEPARDDRELAERGPTEPCEPFPTLKFDKCSTRINACKAQGIDMTCVPPPPPAPLDLNTRRARARLTPRRGKAGWARAAATARAARSTTGAALSLIHI